MGRTACTEPQCLYKGALYLTSVPVQGCTLIYLSACTRVHFTLPQCLCQGALYLASGPVQGSLYLTSVPVQGCTLPYLSACTRVHFTFFTLNTRWAERRIGECLSWWCIIEPTSKLSKGLITFTFSVIT